MELKEHKLPDFILEFSESDDISRFGCENIADNLLDRKKGVELIFEKIELVFVQIVSQKKILVKNGKTYERKLIFS
ncbi:MULTISPECIES: hypothetical protein [Methanobrevibacter]|uniref:hypothetical protein n=1 Tax=Methanobrevibacter TaxID=2172 RepID=UPI000F4E54BE|nr:MULTISPECIES: hypothetical protein [Methanobrevibacter]